LNNHGLCLRCIGSNVELCKLARRAVSQPQQDSVYGPSVLSDFRVSFPFSYHLLLCALRTLYILFLPDKLSFVVRVQRGCFPEMEVRRGTSGWKCEDVIGAASATLSHPPFAKAMSDFPDYYAILGVHRTATTEEVRTAYKKQSLRYAATLLSSVPLTSMVANPCSGSGLTLIAL